MWNASSTRSNPYLHLCAPLSVTRELSTSRSRLPSHERPQRPPPSPRCSVRSKPGASSVIGALPIDSARRRYVASRSSVATTRCNCCDSLQVHSARRLRHKHVVWRRVDFADACPSAPRAAGASRDCKRTRCPRAPKGPKVNALAASERQACLRLRSQVKAAESHEIPLSPG